uniref:PH domain-containing protein n=1 Tax=Rhinopithecus bieti TaxID=61621 RepID=A0A2K6KGW9_RHIBE
MASIMEGPLSKWTNVMKGWQYHWFVLDYNAGLLSYYTSKDKMMRDSRRGCVRLRGAWQSGSIPGRPVMVMATG